MTGHRSTLPLVQSEPWMATAACRGPAAVGVDFFPGQGGKTAPAKAICAGCDHQAACLTYALDHGEHYGIWGGTSARERRSMRKARGRKVAACGTRAGYQRHLDQGTEPCEPCRQAKRDHQRRWRGAVVAS